MTSLKRLALVLLSLTLWWAVISAPGAHADDEAGIETLVILAMSSAALDAAQDSRDALNAIVLINSEREAARDLVGLVKEIQALIDQITEIQEKIAALREQIATLAAQAKASKENIEALQAMIDAQIKEIEKLQQAIEELEAKIDELSAKDEKAKAPGLQDRLHSNLLVVQTSLARIKAAGPVRLTAPEPARTPTPTPGPVNAAGPGEQSELEDALDSFAEANTENPQAQEALSQVAQQIQVNPNEFGRTQQLTSTATPTRTPTPRSIPTVGVPKPVVIR